jgi:hypothetical protein
MFALRSEISRINTVKERTLKKSVFKVDGVVCLKYGSRWHVMMNFNISTPTKDVLLKLLPFVLLCRASVIKKMKHGCQNGNSWTVRRE